MKNNLQVELNKSFDLLKSVFNSVEDMIAIKDLKGMYLFVNKSANDSYKDKFETIVGRTIDEIYSPKEALIVKQLDQLAIDSKKGFRKKVKIYTDKGYLIADLSRSPIFDEENNVVGVISVSKNITKQEKDRMKLKVISREYKRLAYYDDLTEVYNRRMFYKYLMNLNSEDRFVLIMTDLNNFKLINDEFGHSFGDKALLKIANYLKDVFSKHNGKIFRLGGDEFAIIYKEIEIDIMEENIDKLNHFLSLIHNKLSISFGKVLISGEDVKTKIGFDLSIKNADNLMYDYKQKIKNHDPIV